MGKGFPLQRLESAQVPWIMLFFDFVSFIICIKGCKIPYLIKRSLYSGQSPAIFPIAQIAWSTTPGLFSLINLINVGIPLF